jgi:hypothetical protein
LFLRWRGHHPSRGFTRGPSCLGPRVPPREWPSGFHQVLSKAPILASYLVLFHTFQPPPEGCGPHSTWSPSPPHTREVAAQIPDQCAALANTCKCNPHLRGKCRRCRRGGFPRDPSCNANPFPPRSGHEGIACISPAIDKGLSNASGPHGDGTENDSPNEG